MIPRLRRDVALREPVPRAGSTSGAKGFLFHTMQPWKTLSATVHIGRLTNGWTLESRPAEYRDEVRVFRFPVRFDTPFKAPPVVHLGLTGFDIDQRDTSRLLLSAKDITKHGFTAEVVTWRETRVYSVAFSWLALGA
jgi:hypothetical protein